MEPHTLWLVIGNSNGFDESFEWVVCWRAIEAEAKSVADLCNDQVISWNLLDRDSRKSYQEVMFDPWFEPRGKINYYVQTISDDPDHDYNIRYVGFCSQAAMLDPCSVCGASVGKPCHLKSNPNRLNLGSHIGRVKS